MKRHLLALAAAACMCANAHAAEIRVVNADPANQGLNDPTPLAPAGGNPGRSVGEQRRIAYQYAADLWGAMLVSAAEIRVEASFQPLRCDASGTVLGSAGTVPIYVLTEGGDPNTAMLYHGALADALLGTDLDAGTANAGRVDIRSRFNASYGRTNPDGTPCSPGSGWYYGLDGNTPVGLTSFLDTVMHEIAHGLGFSGFGNVSTGAPLSGYRDIYSSFAWDNNTDRGWYQMDNAGRRAATIGGAVTFRGPTVTATAPTVLAEKQVLRVSGTVSADYTYGTAAFGAEPAPANFSGPIVLVNDGSASPSLGCAASPAGAYTGSVALVDRGTCAFEIKARFAQDAGAVAVVVANNTSGIINMADDASVVATVPTVSISQADGQAVKAGLPGVNAAIAKLQGVLAGADAQGHPFLFAPNPVQPGSSFSHYDASSLPNLLMEPAINDSLVANIDVDLSTALFQDEGWELNPGTARIGTCDTTVQVQTADGIAIGGSVQAMAKVCLNNAGGSRANYLRCVTDHASKLQRANLITTTQVSKIRSCASAVTPP